MKKIKTYQNPESSASIAAEPVAAYGYSPNHVQALRDRIIDAINETDDEERLMECVEILHADTMPCVYTDEEFEQECSKIRAEYQWLEERTIEHFARVALTNKYDKRASD